MIKELIILPFLILNNQQGNQSFIYKNNFYYENNDNV